jgi:hypothetical protein
MSMQMVIFPDLPAPLSAAEQEEERVRRWAGSLADLRERVVLLRDEARAHGYQVDARRLDYICDCLDGDGP